MATVYSTQRARTVASGNQFSNGLTEVGAKKRIAFFDYTSSTADAAGTVIELTKLPKGARILGGELFRSALGAGVTLKVGTSASDAAYLAAVDSSALGSSALAATVALGRFSVLDAETLVIATTAGAALPAAGTIQGYIEYVQN